ncbi:MAG: TIGR02710 family CRISPR-associated CARF protein [Bacteroidota bacterium]
MPRKILLITVGGAFVPVVTAIQQLQPDRVIFICSQRSASQVNGDGSPCEEYRGGQVVNRLPNILEQTKTIDRFQADSDIILLEYEDDLEQSYQAIRTAVEAVKLENGSAEIVANYTAGTKTMSVALGLVALDYDMGLYLTKAQRLNLFNIKQGEVTERSSVGSVRAARRLKQIVPLFVAKYDYSPVITELKQLLIDQEIQPEQKVLIREQLDFYRALEAWDCFDHAEAWRELQHKMKDFRELGLFLKRVLSSRLKIDTAFAQNAKQAGEDYSVACHGYELVEDLLLNAERRASQDRFDDAVGRLYRALELLGQIRLLQAYKIETADVDLSILPNDELRQQYEHNKSGKVQLSLRESYKLLCHLDPEDPLGQLYRKKERAILDTLQIRNYSLFAHGFEPITKALYQKVDNVFASFIRDGISTVAFSKTSSKSNWQPIQFPTEV